MKNLLKNPFAVGAAILVLFGLWYAFRPELLFVPKSVDEPFPSPAATHAFVQSPMPRSDSFRVAIL